MSISQRDAAASSLPPEENVMAWSLSGHATATRDCDNRDASLAIAQCE
jgi:hypothetical protein